MYYVEGSHEAIIDKETFAKVQQELKRRAEKYSPAQAGKVYLFTGLIRCALCGKRFSRGLASSGKKYPKKIVWACPTFMNQGKDYCPAQRIPDSILVSKTSEVLGITDWSRETLLEAVTEIRVPGHNRLVYMFRDGHTQEVVWQHPSRKESWTDEMKQKAREKSIKNAERRHQNARHS